MPLEEQEMRMADASGAAAAPVNAPTELESVPAVPEGALILVTTRNLVLFPGTVLPMTLGRQRSIVAANRNPAGPSGRCAAARPRQCAPTRWIHRVGTEPICCVAD